MTINDGPPPEETLARVIISLHEDEQTPIKVSPQTFRELQEFFQTESFQTTMSSIFPPHPTAVENQFLDLLLPLTEKHCEAFARLSREKDEAINSQKFEEAARLREEQIAFRNELKAIREPIRELQFSHFEVVLKQLRRDTPIDS